MRLEAALGEAVKDEEGHAIAKSKDEIIVAAFASQFLSWFDKLELRSPQKLSECRKVIKASWDIVRQRSMLAIMRSIR